MRLLSLITLSGWARAHALESLVCDFNWSIMRHGWRRLLWVGLSARAIGGFVTPRVGLSARAIGGFVTPRGALGRRRAPRASASAASSDLPKDETGVSELLRARPEADGRGVRVAVLDTGCDLAAAGLQTTSAGLPKYLDFVDCTGGGDVAMSAANRTDDGGGVAGLSGRRLELGPWADGVERFRRGAVRLWDVAPASVQQRVKRERRAAFEARQHLAATRVQHRLDAHAREGGGANETAKAAKQDLELQLKLLKEMMSSYDLAAAAQVRGRARGAKLRRRALPSQGTTTRGRCSTCCSSKTRRACRASSSTRTARATCARARRWRRTRWRRKSASSASARRSRSACRRVRRGRGGSG